MRLLITSICLMVMAQTYAQKGEWIAPEGKILNYRTLTWSDFTDKEDKEFAEKLADRNLQAQAYVCPAIYATFDHSEVLDNGRVKFQIHVKCAFQSSSFVRESTKQDHSNYVLFHEQGHYDIALNFANRLQYELSSRDYSQNNYNDEIDKIYKGLLDRYHKTQQTYDGEVNPEGRKEVAQQQLWDMRIKKCLENNTEEYYNSPENVVQTVKQYGQTVKRIPGEAALQFVVRCRPLYSEFPADYTSRIMETKEWTQEPSVIGFYTQKYFVEQENSQSKENYRTLACLFIPNGKDTYKRVMIDTFYNEGTPVKIVASFFANADSDNVKELIITTAATQKTRDASGTLYTNKVYDNVPRLLPGKLKKLDDVAAKIEGGLDGMMAGKPSKAKYRTEKELTEALKKMGYN